MNKNIGIIIGVIVLTVIVGGIYISKNEKNDAMTTDEQTKQVAMEKEKMTEEKAMMEGGEVMMKAGSYETYSPEKIAKASSGDVVLFFRASWCPTCRAIDVDIKSNISKIPADLSILDVDYDNSAELKKKYGVTYQHTFVQVDKDGNLLNKWSGSPTLSALVAEVK